MIKKKLGQVFLIDQNIINTIINMFNPKKNQTIIEIGPGLGALTTSILNIVDSLILIERDSQLIKKILEKYNNKKLKILNQDVMTVNFFHLFNQYNQKLRLVGNLPYNISTKLIIYLFQYIDIIQDMYFMLQKEVGERIIAQPNNKKYGRLSIITQYNFKVKLLLKIPKICFFPIPRVNSVIIQFIPYHINNPYPIVDKKLLSKLTQLVFHQRRKIIQNSLSSLFNMSEIIKNGLNIKLRPENLSIQEFCILVNILQNKINNINL